MDNLGVYRKSARPTCADGEETWVPATESNTINCFDIGDIRDTHCVVTSEGKPRRFMPVEWEALMGFPKGYTEIPYRGRLAEEVSDNPRYRALGNSWAVSCARWVGERIQMIEEAQDA